MTTRVRVTFSEPYTPSKEESQLVGVLKISTNLTKEAKRQSEILKRGK